MYADGADGGTAIRALEESGLTLTQCKVLTALIPGPEGEPQAAKHVAARTGASLPTLSRAIDALVRRDLVRPRGGPRRSPGPQPHPHRAGRSAWRDSSSSTRMDGLATFIADLTPAQRRKLSAALDSLLEREEVAVAYRELKEDLK